MKVCRALIRILPGLCWPVLTHLLSGAEPIKVDMSASQWTTSGLVEFGQHMGQSSIELKPGNREQHSQTGQAVLKDMMFRNGTIEYDVDPSGNMGAGFAFRRRDKDAYELFYLRPQPHCEKAPDCVQYAPQTHGVLLWDLFPQYQGPAPLREGEWNHVKLVISGSRMNVFINGATSPALHIGRLEGDVTDGALMLDGPGMFANLTVCPDVVAGLGERAEKDATAADRRYVRNWWVSAYTKLGADGEPNVSELPGTSWSKLMAERGGLVNVSREYGLPLPRPDRAVVWLKTTIHSTVPQEKRVALGWSREIWIFVNGQRVFADKNLYQPASARKSPDGRLSLENGSFVLPLKAGENEVAAAVANNFYGWGLVMRLGDLKGIRLSKP